MDALDEERRQAGQGEAATPATPDEATAGATSDTSETAASTPAAPAPIVDDDLFDMGGEPLPSDAQASETASGAIDTSNDFLFGESDELFGLDDLPGDKAADGSEHAISQEEYEDLMDKVRGEGQYDKEVAGAADAMVDLPTRSVSFDEVVDKQPAASSEAAAPVAEKSVTATAAASTNDSAPASAPAPAAASPGNEDEITDSEFEDLLDRLHDGGAPGQSSPKSADKSAEPSSTAKQPAAVATSKAATGSSDSAPTATEPTAPKAATPAATATPTKKPAAAKPAAKKSDKEAPAETTVRVDTKRLDDIMNMVGELVLVRNRLVRLGLQSSDESMAKAVANLDVVTGDLQASVMKTRMQPIKKVFGRFPRVVRDLARQLKKEIQLDLKGEETDLDKNLVEALADPLVHLVRNSVDHGIEAPDIREQKGKPRLGTVVLSAEQEGDHILLTIQDDGGGMDANVLRQKAVDKGVMDQDAADRLTDNECFNLIFAPGFSTKEQISDVSGRGVGMDVVKTKITQLNGTVKIDSKLGEGTSIQIKVPLTLAIMPTLMVMLKDQAFAFPLVNVNEIFHLDLTKTNIVDGQEVVVVREKPIPLFYLKRWLIADEQFARADETAHVVVVAVGNNRVGFVVDQLVGQEEVVIKPLGKMLNGTAGMAGATITGDGRIALILDIPSMLARYGNRQASAA